MGRPTIDKKAEEFVDNLLTQEALDTPSDSVKPEELTLQLPEWFDEKKFNQARRFYWDHCYALLSTMQLGLVAVFAVPSILQVLVGSRRSTSVYTAYKRYLSTLLHVISWFEHELKPNSTSWKSLHAVRSRHLRAGLASKLKGGPTVSQRDVALTQFGFIGFIALKPEVFGVRQLQPGDWDAYNHFWRVIGYMIGLEDRYNICRSSMEETRQVCQLVQERVFTPCLENVPEYFEHMAHVMLDGMWSVNPTVETHSLLYLTRYLADVPGYIYTETERIDLERTLREHLKGKPLDSGVEVTALMKPCGVSGLPARAPRLLYLRDFATVDSAPAYKRLTAFTRYKLAFHFYGLKLYSTYLIRLYANLNLLFSILLMKYLPYKAFFRFGIKQSLVDIFVESPSDDSKPKPNAEYYEMYKKKFNSWRAGWISFFWSWKSLHAVRSRHLRAGLASKLKGGPTVSQRDVALTQFGFIGFAALKPERFGLQQMKPGDWDAYNHFWRVIGYMIGLEDRYNICRSSMEETRQVCQLVQERVFTPCLENVPEYFEHMAHVMLDGMWSVNPTVETHSLLYLTRYMADIPGYIYTEAERIDMERTLRKHLEGKPLDSGVEVTALMKPCGVSGLPARAPRLLYLQDFATVDSAPAYKRLTAFARYKLAFHVYTLNLYTTYLVRLYFNLNLLWSILLMKYCPYIAFFRFGIKQSLVDIFAESPADDTKPKPNEEYYEKHTKFLNSWRAGWVSFFW